MLYPILDLDWVMIIVITLGPQCVVAIILGDLLGHPVDPGLVMVVKLTIHSVGILAAIVRHLWDLHSHEIFVHTFMSDHELTMLKVLKGLNGIYPNSSYLSSCSLL